MLPLLLSCGSTRKDFLSGLEGDFVCLARGEVGGKPFSATIHASGRVVYASPKQLCGIIASEDGETLTLGDLTMSAPSLVGLFVPARLMCDGYEVLASGTEGGVCYVDGANVSGSRRVYVTKDGLPCRVVGDFCGIHADFEVVNCQSESTHK